ncbi:MAG: carbohydrate kinase [Candidatus Omnitrophica bacterium]|nr:carbohydrate kinase [Candidatus Omnitrophota bacterium]
MDILFLGGTSIDLIQDKNKERNSLGFTASTGGSITNSAVISARLGLKTAMISRVGKDPLGDFAKRFLKSCRVNTSGMIQDPNIRTPIAVASIDKKGNSKYTFYKNTSKDSIVCFRNASKKLLRSAKILHFGSSFSYQKDTYPEALKYVKFLKKRGAFISFDPNFRPYNIKDKRASKNRVLELLKWIDLAKLSEVDLEFLMSSPSATADKLQRGSKAIYQKALKTLKKQSKCEIILTLGSKGSMYLDSAGKIITAPAFKVKIADTIGAGDAFTAGLLYKIAKIGERQVFKNIKPILTFASALSAIICTKSGANKGLKDIKQANSFPAKHHSE